MRALFSIKTALIAVFLISTRELVSRVLSSQKDGSSFGVSKTHSEWNSRQILQYMNTNTVLEANGNDSVECSEVTSRNSSLQCIFVKTTPDCQLSNGFIQYLYLPYCLLPHGAAFFILFLWLGFLFVILGITADDYFCPSLVIISKTLRLSQNVAGVTFLAYGNGAPDIFSAIAAFSHSTQDHSTAELGIEALFGAGIFVTTMVMGVIILIAKNFTVTKRPFIRDIIFYLGAVGWMTIALYKQELSMWQSIGLIMLYIGYVIVVIGGRYIYQYWKKKKRIRGALLNDGKTVIHSVLGSQSLSTSSYQQDETSPLLQGISPVVSFRSSLHENPLKKLFHDVLPFTSSDWQQAGLIEKILFVIKAPATFVLNLTTPVVDYAEPDHRWNKWLNVIHCVTGPVFVVMSTKVGLVNIGSQFPLWTLTLCIGLVIGLFVAIVTRNDHPPRCHWMFAYLAFVVSVVWIYITANEIVNLLQTFGIAFKLSNAILGLTFLAWGNSIGDLISNAAMARQGYPNMAASACFGGPMLNLLLGIGIACTYLSVKQGHSVVLPHRYHQYIISASFLTVSLVSSGVIIPLMGFKVSRPYGAYLVFLYISYLTISIVSEVIHL